MPVTAEAGSVTATDFIATIAESAKAASARHAIDDRVMGGISRSTLRHDPAGHAVFEGAVSMERNGGFVPSLTRIMVGVP